MAIKIREQENGVTVYQVTEDEHLKSNIYCETPWCSADGRNFVYQHIGVDGGPNNTEYILCEFGTWETQRIGRGLSSPSINYDGIFHYRRVRPDGVQELVRVNLDTQGTEVIYEFSKDLPLQTQSWGAVSRDERYFAYGVVLGYDPQRFGIELLDMADGSRNLIVEDPYIHNPHTQFEPSKGRQFLVQHNRGCRFLPDGTRLEPFGPWGNTCFIVDVPDGKITRLQIGGPFTHGITGFGVWIGDTGDILTTVPKKDVTPRTGDIYRVSPGKPPRIISGGILAAHLGTVPSGRFFCHDLGEIGIGSVETGKRAAVCHSETTATKQQHTHPHAYLSPDLKWVVFNSTRPGRTQIHAASIPPEMIAELEKA